MSKLHLQVNQYTQFGRRSRALFREIMLAVCEGLVGEHEKHCPKCRHVVGFWQLSLGTLADAYALWLLSPIQWHERCPKPRCEIARALRNAVAHSDATGERVRNGASTIRWHALAQDDGEKGCSKRKTGGDIGHWVPSSGSGPVRFPTVPRLERPSYGPAAHPSSRIDLLLVPRHPQCAVPAGVAA